MGKYIKYQLKTKKMKNMTKILLIVLAAIAGIASGKVYTRSKSRKGLNDSDVQHIDCLKLEDVLEWCDRKLEKNGKCTLRILPNDATLKIFNERLNLNEKDLSRCIYIIVIENGSQNILLKKLVIPNTISQELSIIKKGIIFTVPIE